MKPREVRLRALLGARDLSPSPAFRARGMQETSEDGMVDIWQKVKLTEQS